MTLGTGVGTGILSRPIFRTDSSGDEQILSVSSAATQEITGSANGIYIMPYVNTLVAGWATLFINNSTGAALLKSKGGDLIAALSPGQTVSLMCKDIATEEAAAWDVVGLSPRLWLSATNDAVTVSNATETDLTWTGTIGNMTGALAIGGPNYGVFTAPTTGNYTFRTLLQYEGTGVNANNDEGLLTVKLTDSANTLIKTIRTGGVLEDGSTPITSGTETLEWTLSLTAADTVKVRVIYTDGGDGNGLYFYVSTCQLKITQEL